MDLRKIGILTFLITCLLPVFAPVIWAASDPFAAPETEVTGDKLLNPEEIVSNQLDKLDFVEVERIVQEMNQELGDYFPTLNVKQVLQQVIKGEVDWNFQTLLAGIGRFLFHEVLANTALLAQLLILAVICAVLQNLQSGFGEGTIGKLAQGVCYLTLLTIALGSFAMAMEIARQAVTNMVTFIQAFLPILMTLMVAMGGFTSVAMIHPYITAALGILTSIVNYVLFPLIFLAAVLSIVNQLSDRFQVTRLAGLLRQASIWGLGLVMTLFIGVLSIQGVMGAVADGVTLRAAKFATGTFVPIVGGAFADALDAIIGYSFLLKNSIGIIGLIILFVICLLPVMKILAITFTYKIVAVLVQPLGDDGTAEALQNLSSSLSLIMITVACVGLMFFIAIAITIGVSSLVIMLR